MLTSLLLAVIAYGAEIYNPLDPSPVRPEEGPSAAFGAGVDLRHGNVDKTKIFGTAALIWVRPRDEWRVILRGRDELASGDLIDQEVFAHFRLTHTLSGPWNLVTFAQASTNPFRELRLRALAGGGAEWRAYPTEYLRVSLALTLMGEFNDLTEGVDDDDQGLHPRLSSYAVLSTRLNNRASTGFVGFFQPRIDGADALANQRAMLDLFLNVDLTPSPAGDEAEQKHVVKGNLRWALTIDYDSQPPPEVEKIDLGVATTFGLSWK